MKLWVGTGIIEEQVDVFLFDRPGPDKWFHFLESRRPGEGYWGVMEYNMVMDRADAEREFVTMPTHGTNELIEYEISGNGTLV